MSRSTVRVGFLTFLFMFMIGWSARDAAAQSCLGGIGDFVWFDANQNGLRDPAEGNQGINGIVLELRDSTGALVATKTTGAAVGSIPGSYNFLFLCPGTYTVTIVSGVPAGYVPTLAGVGTDPSRDSSTSPVTFTLAAGQKDPNIDFGFNAGCSGSIGDRVWSDTNANGVQDAGEVGMAGVPVRLYLNGAQVANATTDGSGNYTFQGLCPGSYTVVVDTPTGFVGSPALGTPDSTLDSDVSGVVVPLASAESNPTIDFGFYAQCRGSIGDRVWFDSNRNGIQDAGELGIAGVTLKLGSGGSAIAEDITDGNGDYLFTGLCAGDYSVTLLSGTLPDGVVPTLASPPGGGNAANDSNSNPAAITLTGDDSDDLTIDFGFNAPCTGQIGDVVWNDVNANGIQDAGELGIPYVRVTLRDRATNAVLAVDTTDANGVYLFEGLCLGDYIVEVDPKSVGGGMVPSPHDQGSNDAIDSDGVDHEALVSLPADNTTDLTVDFGYYRKALIQIVKLTNGADHNSPTGPVVPVGDTVTWTYNVTNAGSTEPLADVIVVDDNGTPGNPVDDFSPLFSSGDTNGDTLLDVGETWVFVATGTATAGQYVNWASVTGSGSLSHTPAGPSQDLDHYFGKEAPPPPRTPGLKILKSANKDKVVFGEAVTFTYIVTNTGDVDLTDVVVTDDNATPLYHADDFTVGTVALLGPGQSTTFTATRVPPTKMCNYDWLGKHRKCGMMLVEHHQTHTKFTYLQSRDHRDDFVDGNGWAGHRSYSYKTKFRMFDRSDTDSQDVDGVVVDMLGDEEYTSRFEAWASRSFVTSDDGGVTMPKFFHKNGWDSDWHSDWDFRFGGGFRSGRWDDDRWGHDNDKDYDYGKHPKPCETTSTNVATVEAHYGDATLKATDKATVQVVAPVNPSPYKSFTQGGWGAKPYGGNPGKFLSNNFSQVYPGGAVVIGGTKTLRFTSAYAIERFLPQGGTPAKLTYSYVNPIAQFSVFAGQVLALRLNVDFSAAGLTRRGLGNLTVVSGELAGSTVAEVLELANRVLGGGTLPWGLTLSELNSIVSRINENFDGGVQNNGYLSD